MNSAVDNAISEITSQQVLRGGSLSEVIKSDELVFKVYRGTDARGYAKLRNEVNFITNIPRSIRKYYPAVVDVIDTGTVFGYSMPYYNKMKSMSDVMFSDTELPYIWQKLDDITDFMNTRHYPSAADDLDTFGVNEIVHERLTSAETSLRKHKDLHALLDGGMTVGGTRLLSLDEIKKRLLSDSFTNNKMLPETQDFFHGNFHLDNILISDDDFMLIDPRGGATGSRLYDICKMFVHMLIRYDEIHTDRFKVTQDNGSFSVQLTDPRVGIRYDYIQNKYLDKSLETMDDAYFMKCLQIIGGVHAVSFSSYHARKTNVNIDRVKAYLAGGMLLLTQYLHDSPTELRQPLYEYGAEASL